MTLFKFIQINTRIKIINQAYNPGNRHSLKNSLQKTN